MKKGNTTGSINLTGGLFNLRLVFAFLNSLQKFEGSCLVLEEKTQFFPFKPESSRGRGVSGPNGTR